jgi:hypothetical protein
MPLPVWAEDRLLPNSPAPGKKCPLCGERERARLRTRDSNGRHALLFAPTAAANPGDAPPWTKKLQGRGGSGRHRVHVAGLFAASTRQGRSAERRRGRSPARQLTPADSKTAVQGLDPEGRILVSSFVRFRPGGCRTTAGGPAAGAWF